MARFALLSLALVAAAAAAEFHVVPHKDCKSVFEVKTLEASECDIRKEEIKGEQREICVLKAGSKPVIRITFVPNEDGVEGLETSVRAKFGKSTLPYSMSDFQTCEHGHIACPLKKGQEYTYFQEFHVDPSYPKEELFQVNWSIGKGATKHICLVYLAKIEE